MAGLCEMWFTLSRWSWKTLSWVIGLILYKNNDLTSVVGIISNLYRKLIKYANKIMNPFKDSLCHKIVEYAKLKIQLFDNCYIWTSKIMDPTERITLYIVPILLNNNLVNIQFLYSYYFNFNRILKNGYNKLSKRNKLFLIESGNSIFKYIMFKYTYGKGETIAKSDNRKTIALEKGRKEKVIIEKYLTGQILFVSNSITDIAIVLGYDRIFIENYIEWMDKISINNLPLISLNKRWGFVRVKRDIKRSINNNSVPLMNNFLKCTPNTKRTVSLDTTHLEKNNVNGNYLMKQQKIYPNKDGKYRNLSKFLYDPLFLITIYNNLKSLKLINEEIENQWFINIAFELKNGNYTPIDMYIKNEKNKSVLINHDKNKIISEAIRVLLESVYDNNDNKFLSFSHGSRKNKNIHSALQVIKNEWNDIIWFISFDYNMIFQSIHRKKIFSVLRKDIQDQRLFDILNKLFNSGVCTLSIYNTFNRYILPDYDLLSCFLINIFFHELDKEILKIKNTYFFFNKNDNYEFKFNSKNYMNDYSNIRFVRYLNTFLLGVKGTKLVALDIKKKVEYFLKSNLHLELLNNSGNLINIRSDNLFIFNVIIASKPLKTLKFYNTRSNFIQQQKKGIKIRKSKIQLLKTKQNNFNGNFENSNIQQNLSSYKKTVLFNKNSSIINQKLFNNKYSIVLNADLTKIKRILINTGILNKKGRPVALRKLLSLDSFFIFTIYMKIGKLVLNSFSFCDNIEKIKTILDYHIRWSLFHTLAAKHKSTIRKTLRNIYPSLLTRKNDNCIQYYTKEDIKNIKRKFLIDKNIYSIKDIDWSDKDLNLYSKINRNNKTGVFSLWDKSIYTGRVRLNGRELRSLPTYIINKPLSNKRTFSSININNSRISINKKSSKNDVYFFNIQQSYEKNRCNYSIYNKNNNNEGLLFKSIYNKEYLLNIYPYFAESVSNNKGQFWNIYDKELLKEEFLNWFAGFTDAEGLFYIKLRKGYHTCSFSFELHLHVDDVPTLAYIKKRLNIGKVRVVKNSAFFYVNIIKEIEILIDIFDKHPLWTHKQLDFKSFKYAFFNKDNYLRIMEIKSNMNAKRFNFVDYVLPDYRDITPYWLVGFVEGDGCFCISKMKAYFYLCQKDDQILGIICKFLIYFSAKEHLISNIDNYEELVVTPFMSPKVRKKKNINPINVISICDQDIIYQYIGPFFPKRIFITRKGFDFYIWLLCIHLIINGYFKLKEGKKLILLLSINMNNARYSNKLFSSNLSPFHFLSLYKSLQTVFSEKPPFNIYSNLKHRSLAVKHRSSNCSVFVYKNDKLIEGSPFKNYKEASKILNVPVSKISEYIDTDIKINDYLFFKNICY